ncbi:acyl-CoA dehydrogenase family protein [Streptomyces sp. NPDC048639]|uniref:acyl-CoA dehydrogenase family protein n=1 Tax=Streptomyces sp. NPDC048639 TaxID=3365581 RepID=UPI00371BD496
MADLPTELCPLSPEQTDIVEPTRAFARDEIRPHARAVDEAYTVTPWELWRAAATVAKVGITGLLRGQFGRPITEHRAVALRPVDMRPRTEQARLMTRRAAKRRDAGTNTTGEAAMAGLTVSETAAYGTWAVQPLGGRDHSREYPVEQGLRDDTSEEIAEGTSGHMHLIISRSL